MKYIENSRSIAVASGQNDDKILKIIADHFMGNHTEVPFQFKVDYEDGIKMNTRGRYLFEFNHYFPDAEIGDKCSSEGKLFCYEDKNISFLIKSQGPTSCYVNGQVVYVSSPNEESDRIESRFPVSLKKGYNTFTFTTEKTTIGFGFTFSNFLPQWEPYLFQSNTCTGQLGFRFTKPYKVIAEGEALQFCFPEIEDNVEEEPSVINFSTAFEKNWLGYAYAKAKLHVKNCEELKIVGEFPKDNLKISIDGSEFHNISNTKIEKGEHIIIMQVYRESESSVFLDILLEAKNSIIKSVEQILGYDATWLYLGTFKDEVKNVSDLLTMHKVFNDGNIEKYWKPLPKNLILRPTVESELYGRFTYPMGVTLYGYLKCGDYLNDKRYINYVTENVELIAKYHDYALFDKKRCGYPSVNQQVAWLNELDDCGSFGSLMLESNKYISSEEVIKLANRIANYMTHIQRRESDGAFSRNDDTMWIDDMYMSIPFLVRNYEVTGEAKYIDDACKQALLFKKYFFIDETKLMSHIFDVKKQKANKIPWSRGNGWVIFSLSELLKVLPKNHEKYEEIVAFFNEHSSGILNVQGESGLWHQILDDKTVYAESSSTAMFICAFSRSIMEGYADEALKIRMINAVERAWNGIINTAVDDKGNLYGVCRGSGYSFSRSYYRSLSWRYNDAHGIGIVLLAGVEKNNLSNFLETYRTY